MFLIVPANIRVIFSLAIWSNRVLIRLCFFWCLFAYFLRTKTTNIVFYLFNCILKMEHQVDSISRRYSILPSQILSFVDLCWFQKHFIALAKAHATYPITTYSHYIPQTDITIIIIVVIVIEVYLLKLLTVRLHLFLEWLCVRCYRRCLYPHSVCAVFKFHWVWVLH